MLLLMPNPNDIPLQKPATRPRLSPSLPLESYPDMIPRITADALVAALNEPSSSQGTQFLLLDCRFQYEFDGGHIEGATNSTDERQIDNLLFGTNQELGKTIILYCELSLCRAPKMARYLRSQDRAANADCYPRLSYPEVYVLERGYENFFSHYPDQCSPRGYVKMDDARYLKECVEGMRRIHGRRSHKPTIEPTQPLPIRF
ncbi:hypothetical protein MRS44_003817 [Fusarium solani]|uniref:uncharacterized protein n=1 Tax=Fusarium solani TaxID=169388 RepID=UPI0032C4576A|nr:hypothetical protein MRS44_003817 [Fusarium solani]